jgi:integrase-like protein
MIDLRVHDLRHEAGSRWLEAGWPIHYLKEMLGHANISQTDTYLNVSRMGLHESMKRFDDVRCKTVASQAPIEHKLARNDDLHEAGKTCYTDTSNPYAPVAQWIEHRPSKPRVAGSSPAGRASLSQIRPIFSGSLQLRSSHGPSEPLVSGTARGTAPLKTAIEPLAARQLTRHDLPTPGRPCSSAKFQEPFKSP